MTQLRAELYGKTSLERAMRKHIFPIWFGLTFLLIVGGLFPIMVHTAIEMWPREGLVVWAGWALVVNAVVNWRTFRRGLDFVGASVLTPIVEGAALSVFAAIVSVQAWPTIIPIALLDVTAAAFGKALLYSAIWPFVVVFFAYLIAPQRSLVQADHPVQYRDRENISKFLLGAAGVALLYQIIKMFC
jgi:hypothetical protein